MSEHRATIRSSRNGADFGYKNYSRDHVWLSEDGVGVRGLQALVRPTAEGVAALYTRITGRSVKAEELARFAD